MEEKIIKFTDYDITYSEVNEYYVKYSRIIIDLGDLEINPQLLNYMLKLYRFSINNSFELIFFITNEKTLDALVDFKKYFKIFKDYNEFKNIKIYTNFEVKMYMNNEYMRNLLKDTLLKNGFRIKERREVNFLNKKHDSKSTDIYVVDYDTYKQEKINEIKKIKSKNENANVILLVNAKSTEAAIKTVDIGVDSIIEKPFKMDDFLKIVKKLAVQTNLKLENIELNNKVKDLYTNLEKELKLAKDIQQSILPPKEVEFNGYKISYIFSPSQDIGGDFLDIIKLDEDRIGVIFADIAGHGIPAALLSSMLNAFIKSEILKYDKTNDFLENLNEKIIDIFPKGKFVSVFYLIINTKTHVMNYCKSSQEPALYLENENVVELETKGQVLGIFSKKLFANMVSFNEKQINFSKNAKLLLYTDGITEAYDKDNKMYGIDKLKNVLIDSKADINKIKESTSKYNIVDDLTLLVISRN